jgi:hypothetical protein
MPKNPSPRVRMDRAIVPDGMKERVWLVPGRGSVHMQRRDFGRDEVALRSSLA